MNVPLKMIFACVLVDEYIVLNTFEMLREDSTRKVENV